MSKTIRANIKHQRSRPQFARVWFIVLIDSVLRMSILAANYNEKRETTRVVSRRRVSLWDWLACAEDTVAGITQTRKDIILVVESLVECRQVDIYVGVLLLHSLHTLGRCHQTHQTY